MDNSKNWIFGMVLVVAVICLSIVTAGSSYRASAPIKARLSSNIQPAPPVCGNNWCQAGETFWNCENDCDNICGNLVCEVNFGETYLNCSSDCSDNDLMDLFYYYSQGYVIDLYIEQEYLNKNDNIITNFGDIYILTGHNPFKTINEITFKKYNLDEYTFYDTNNCSFNNKTNNSLYINPGQLLPLSYPDWLENNYTISCNEGGYYEITTIFKDGINTVSEYSIFEIMDCGNSICEPNFGENIDSCPIDCTE